MFIEGGARVDALRQEGHVFGISAKFHLPGHMGADKSQLGSINIALLAEGRQVTTRVL